MLEVTKKPKLVGTFIRNRRETLGLSQRALGLLFTPPVTTQFISNVERGVTPLPPVHVAILAKALQISEVEIMGQLEREYTVKLSGKLLANGTTSESEAASQTPSASPTLLVAGVDYHFMKSVYEAYRQSDHKTKRAFATVCESILNVMNPALPNSDAE